MCEREVKRLRQEVESERMKRHRHVGGGNHSKRNSLFWQWELVNKRVEIEGSEPVRWRDGERCQEEWKRRRSWVRTVDTGYAGSGQHDDGRGNPTLT